MIKLTYFQKFSNIFSKIGLNLKLKRKVILRLLNGMKEVAPITINSSEIWLWIPCGEKVFLFIYFIVKIKMSQKKII